MLRNWAPTYFPDTDDLCCAVAYILRLAGKSRCESRNGLATCCCRGTWMSTAVTWVTVEVTGLASLCWNDCAAGGGGVAANSALQSPRFRPAVYWLLLLLYRRNLASALPMCGGLEASDTFVTASPPPRLAVLWDGKDMKRKCSPHKIRHDVRVA
jgi:hypothetical protein